MEEIHNTYCHFDWYNNFIIAFVESDFNLDAAEGDPIVNVFIWDDSRQGSDYWNSIYDELKYKGITTTFEQADIFDVKARGFYTSLYEELKLTNPELFI